MVPLSRAEEWDHIGAEVGSNHTRALYGWAGPDWATWFHEKDAGPLRDLGVYGLTTLTGLLGAVRSVHALANNRDAGDERAPDNFQLSLEFSTGCLATLATGYVQQKYKTPGIELYGARGMLQYVGQDWRLGDVPPSVENAEAGVAG